MCFGRHHRVRLVLWLFVLAPMSSASMAKGFCALLAAHQPSQQGDMALFEAAGLAPEAVCAASRALSGNVSNHCHWSFPYRSAASAQGFDALVQRVADCADTADDHDGDAVNHPDSYDLRRFTVAGKSIDVSLKDKAALQQSIVFLRISGAP